MNKLIKYATSLAALTALSMGSAAADTTLKVNLGNFYMPDTNPELSAEAQMLADEYEKLHPDVKIELIPHIADADAFSAWLTTRFAANDAPDITWQSGYKKIAEGTDNWAPLNDYFSKPNPYVGSGGLGSEKWSDLFPANVLNQTRGGDGNWFQVSTNWVETGFYVNQDIMSKQGLDVDSWKDWGDLLSACRSLREVGVQPMGVFMTPGWSTYQWLDSIIATGSYADVIPSWYLEKYSNEYQPWRLLTQEEMARAVHLGKYITSGPRFDTYLGLVKGIADDCLVEGFAGIPDYDAVYNMFYNEKVAMVWLGSWSAPSLKDLPFEVKATYMPAFGPEQSKYEVHNESYRVGGPSSSGQWGITAQATDRGNLDQAVDFLRFLTAPVNYGRLAMLDTGFIPMVKGVETPDISANFQAVAQLPERGFTDPIARLTPKFGTAHNRLLQSFMLGEMSADDLKVKYQTAMDRAVEDLCLENEGEWKWCSE